MGRELVVTGLDGFQTLGGFAGGENDQDGIKARLLQNALDGGSESRRDVGVGNDGAPAAQFLAGAGLAQPGEEAGVDVNFVTAIAERYVDGCHATRIRTAGIMSKFSAANVPQSP